MNKRGLIYKFYNFSFPIFAFHSIIYNFIYIQQFGIPSEGVRIEVGFNHVNDDFIERIERGDLNMKKKVEWCINQMKI